MEYVRFTYGSVGMWCQTVGSVGRRVTAFSVVYVHQRFTDNRSVFCRFSACTFAFSAFPAFFARVTGFSVSAFSCVFLRFLAFSWRFIGVFLRWVPNGGVR